MTQLINLKATDEKFLVFESHYLASKAAMWEKKIYKFLVVDLSMIMLLNIDTKKFNVICGRKNPFTDLPFLSASNFHH